MSSYSEETSAKLFRCPTCGASLDVVDAPSITCKYCGNSVPIPAHLRPQRPQMVQPQVIIQTPSFDLSPQYTEAVRSSQRIGCIITAVILLFVGGIVVFSLLSAQGAIQDALGQVGIDPGAIGLGGSTDSSFAELALEFGGKGSGAGKFDDPRYVAVDPNGNIFVADYDSGRLQKFDPAGKFALLIQVEPDSNGNTYIQGMTADYRGNIYVSRGGDILKYSAESGRLVDTIAGDFPDTIYDGVAIDAANNIYAMHSSAGEDDLLKLSPEGEVLERWTSIVSGVNKDDPAIGLSLAVDGSGNPLIASSFASQVYEYDTNGRFVDRFGEEGTGKGQLESPGALVVDGQDRVFVTTFGRVDAFDRGGKYLGSLPFDYTKGTPFGVAVDLDGNVYVVTNQGLVMKFTLK